MHSYHTTSAGLNLVELLVALIIGVLIVQGVGICLIKCIELERKQSAIIAIQHNASKALDILKKEIRKSGYIGCMRLSAQYPQLTVDQQSLNLKNRLVGGRNQITVRYIKFPGMVLVENMQNPQELIMNPLALSKNEFFVIADCKHAEMFKVDKISQHGNKQFLRASKPLKYTYNAFSEIGMLVKNRFTLEKISRVDSQGRSLYALFLTDIHHRKTEIVDHLADLNLRYMIAQSDGILEQEGSKVRDWSKVIGVALAITPQSTVLKKKWYGFQSVA